MRSAMGMETVPKLLDTFIPLVSSSFWNRNLDTGRLADDVTSFDISESMTRDGDDVCDMYVSVDDCVRVSLSQITHEPSA